MTFNPPAQRLSLIAAMTENRVIGIGGSLPWKLPDEMAQFRAYTLGHAVIMGRKNFEAEGKPLPHRRNIVLTTQQDWTPTHQDQQPSSGVTSEKDVSDGIPGGIPGAVPGGIPKNTPEKVPGMVHGMVPGAGVGVVEVCHSFDEALALIGNADPEPFVIGGAKVYELALPRVDRMVLTTVHATLEGDTFFPDFDPAEWSLTDARHHLADARHQYAFTLNTYDRVR